MSSGSRKSRGRNAGGSRSTTHQYNTLFVTVDQSKFPDYINRKHLRDHFSEFDCDIVNTIIVRDLSSKKSKGYGFVEFSSASVAANAMSKLRGSKLRGKFPLFLGYRRQKHSEDDLSFKQATSSLSIDEEHDDSSDSHSTASVDSHLAAVPESSSLFVRPVQSKFPDYIQSGHLERHFRSEFGDEVLSAYIARDMKTKKTKGFGRVNFRSVVCAKEAKARLSGSLLSGKIKLQIEFHKHSRSKSLSDWSESRSAIQTPPVQEVPIRCKPEQTLFLRHCFLDSTTPQVQLLKKTLPAKMIDKSGCFHLSGSKASIKSSCEILNRFLSDIKHFTVSYSCHNKFARILKKHFISSIDKSKQGCVTCVLQESRLPQETNSTLTVHVFSQELEEANLTSKRLKELKPQSKLFCLRPESSKMVDLEECIESISNEHRTLAERKGQQSLSICGFSADDIEDAWKEIKTKVDSMIVVTKVMPFSAYQLKYLKAMYATYLSEVQAECELVFPDLPVPPESTLEIKLRGKTIPVNRTVEKLKTIKTMCKIEKVSVQCPKIHLHIWKRRWDAFSADKKIGGVFIDYATLSAGRVANYVTVSFTVYGDNISAVQEAKLAIIRYENGQSTRVRQLKLSDEQFKVLTTRLPKLQDELVQTSSVYLNSDLEKKEANLVVPLNSTVNILEIEQKLKLELSPKSIVKTITFNDKVASKLLPIKHMLENSHHLRFLKATFQKTGTHLVVQLEGATKEVQAAKFFLKQCIKLTQSMQIATKRLSIPAKHVPILSSAQFTSCVSTVQEKLDVVCYFPTPKTQEVVILDQVEVKCSAGSVCTVQLCKGRIIEEEVDAVIAPTNILLNTTLFSATKDIARAAGPEILAGACSEFLMENIAPCLGDAVEIDCGDLQFQSLILAVIERDNENVLVQAVQKAFQLACESRFGSLSISSMMHAFPSHVLTKVVLDTLDRVQPCSDFAMHTVRIVLPPIEPSALASQIVKDYHTRKSTTVTANSHSELHASQHPQSFDSLHSRSFITGTKDVSSQPCTPDTSSQTAKRKWMWQDDTKQFVEFTPEISDKLTKMWKEDQSRSTFLIINATVYIIDFGSMTQKNMSTRHKRRIKYCFDSSKVQGLGYDSSYSSSLPSLHLPTVVMESSPAAGKQSASFQWLYKNDTGVYTPYHSIHSNIIELMYLGRSSQRLIEIGKWAYSFDFQDMKQVNIKTNTRRSIKRESSPYKSKVAVVPVVQSPTVNEPQDYIGLRGPKVKMEEATKTIRSKLQSLSITRSVPLPPRLTTDSVFQCTLENIIQKHRYVHIHKANDVSASSKKESILVEGEEQKVLSAVTEIQSEIISLSADREDTHYPDEWEPQVKTCKVFEVAEDSSEWIRISSQFKETMHDSEITSIKRVQNKWLWEKYQSDKKRMQTKNKGSVNEMDLFHGSRKVSADVIVHSEEGFDMRFSSEGMWGQANYFAMKAKYSDTYAYQHLGNQTKELLVAKVLTGESITLPANKNLRMPPEKQQTGAISERMLTQVRYDTVNGTTHGSTVYMTYSNEKAYPAYVITYRRHRDREAASRLIAARKRLLFGIVP